MKFLLQRAKWGIYRLLIDGGVLGDSLEPEQLLRVLGVELIVCFRVLFVGAGGHF